MSDERRAPIKLKLKTTIRQPGQDEETYELWSEGMLLEKRDRTYLHYEEIQENQEKIITTVKIGPEESLILRKGAVNMRMPFVLNRMQNGHFDSEHGTLLVVTNTKKMLIERSEDERSGRFLIQYDLIMGEQIVGDYTLEFSYTEGTR